VITALLVGVGVGVDVRFGLLVDVSPLVKGMASPPPHEDKVMAMIPSRESFGLIQ
jgi:hypothetical protein